MSSPAQKKNKSGRPPSRAKAAALPHLIDQVGVSTSRDQSLDGSALWVLLAMYRSFAVLDRDQADEVAAMGLTPLQFNILTTLQRARHPTTMGALATMLVVRPTNLSGNINALAERGLIRREVNRDDQRSLLAVLTAQGEVFLEAHLPAHWRRLERLMAGLTREQRLNLVNLLKLLVASIHAEQQNHAPAGPGPKARARRQPPS